MSSRRVHEVAKEAGVASADVLRELAVTGVAATSASSSVPADVAAAVLTRLRHPDATEPDFAEPGGQADDGLEALVRRAFAKARASKADGWRTMTLPVLKNRLLQLTERRFSEQAYGHESMAKLAAALPELLDLDTGSRPAAVTLREAATVPASAEVRPSPRIRGDLWDAVMNYSAGHRWAWSGTAAVPEYDAPDGAPLLPTLSADELAQWRAEFAAGHAGDPGGKDLGPWALSSGATRQLPPAMRPVWNADVKARVLGRLAEWFAATGIMAPDDAASGSAADAGQGRPVAGPARAGSLRAFVAGCVAVMTDEELASLVLPAPAVHRYADRRG